MAQNIGNLLKGRAPPHQVGGHGVAEHVCAWTVTGNTSLPENRLRNTGEDHRGGQRFVWWAEVEKDLAMRAGWPSLLEVAHHRLAGVLRQRQHTLATGFPGTDQHVTRSPVDIV
jgi:hypothetical protein